MGKHFKERRSSSSTNKGKIVDTDSLSSSSRVCATGTQGATENPGVSGLSTSASTNMAGQKHQHHQHRAVNDEAHLTYREVCTAVHSKDGDCIHVAVFTRPAHDQGAGHATRAMTVDGHSIRNIIMQSSKMAATMDHHRGTPSCVQGPFDSANATGEGIQAVADAVASALGHDASSTTTYHCASTLSFNAGTGSNVHDGSLALSGRHGNDRTSDGASNGPSTPPTNPIPIPVNISGPGAARSFGSSTGRHHKACLSADGSTARSGGSEFVLPPDRHIIYKVGLNTVQPEPIVRLFIYTGPSTDPLPGLYLFVAGHLQEGLRYYEERGPDPRELRNYAWHIPVMTIPAGDLPPNLDNVPTIPSSFVVSPSVLASASSSVSAPSSNNYSPHSVFEVSSDEESDAGDEDEDETFSDEEGNGGPSTHGGVDLNASSSVGPTDVPAEDGIAFFPPPPANVVDPTTDNNSWHPELHSPFGGGSNNNNPWHVDENFNSNVPSDEISNIDALRELCHTMTAPGVSQARGRSLFCTWESVYRSAEWADDVVVNAFLCGLAELISPLRFEYL